MARSTTLRIKIEAEGITETLRAFRTLDKQASVELRDASRDIAVKAVPRVKAAAGTPMQQLVASSTKVARDRVPAVQMGGRGLPGVLVAGAEFGGGRRRRTYARRNPVSPGSHMVNRAVTRQFGPHTGNDGRFFFPTMRDLLPVMLTEWRQAVDRILARWAAGGER